MIGGNSNIGQHLLPKLKNHGWHVVYTTRQKQSTNSYFLDLERPESWKAALSENYNICFFLAGNTSIAFCNSNLVDADVINRKHTIALLEMLVKKNTWIVFLSTNQVFDGERSYQKISDSCHPICTYGKLKRSVECYLLDNRIDATIVRLTKVIGTDFPLLEQFAELSMNGKEIGPFSDMYMAPVPISLVADVLTALVCNPKSGILQVSGQKDSSYAQVMRYIVRSLGGNESLIKPASAKMQGIVAPRNTTMEFVLKGVIDISAPSLERTLESLVNKLTKKIGA